MSCEYCKEISVEYQISSQSNLRRAIAVARDNIADGTIREIPPHPSNRAGAVSFQEVANGGAWEDLVSFNFQCTRCGQQFQLAAETYHGSGGAWRPVAAKVANAL